MGLLRPTQGEILLNGKELNKDDNLQNYLRNKISHVLEYIFTRYQYENVH